MEIITLDRQLYVPDFDPDTDMYYDRCPFVKYQRDRKTVYDCPCKVGSTFTTPTKLYQHWKTKGHQMYLTNFAYYNKPIIDRDLKIKELTIKVEKLQRSYNDAQSKLDEIVNNFKGALDDMEFNDVDESQYGKDHDD